MNSSVPLRSFSLFRVDQGGHECLNIKVCKGFKTEFAGSK